MHDLREFDCVKGIGTTKVYAIAEPTTTDEALWEARDNKVEVKCFDFDTFWRVREVIEGKKSVVFSCRQRIERDIIAKLKKVTETGGPTIVNSLQKVKAVRKAKFIGVNITPTANEPGISMIDQLDEIVSELGIQIRTVSYLLDTHRNVDDLKKIMTAILESPELSKATIIDLGEWTFASDEEAEPYMEVLRWFRSQHNHNFEFRFGVII